MLAPGGNQKLTRFFITKSEYFELRLVWSKDVIVEVIDDINRWQSRWKCSERLGAGYRFKSSSIATAALRIAGCARIFKGSFAIYFEANCHCVAITGRKPCALHPSIYIRQKYTQLDSLRLGNPLFLHSRRRLFLNGKGFSS